ncbi:MAG: DEAD/DEAH box helicase, partial [Candidatus Falkowbacteria bacterium]|nr:DEAD/DEAH box helicase [Candidatus Falkowbacteria bacterium]
MSVNKKLAVRETKDLTFSELGINKAILAVLDKLNLVTPTPIQAKSIPVALGGDDLIGVAQTGTGKTFAFGIPMLQRLEIYKGKGLVVLPTRELALQVDESLKKLAGNSNLKTVTLIGGENIGRQLMLLRRDPHIIVATPGRLNDHLKRKTVKLDTVKILVLDEADMMFDMGFAPQIEEILKYVPKNRQTLLFSATMPPEIIKLTATHMKTPVHIEVAPQGTTAAGIDQEIYLVKKEDKLKHLEKILQTYSGSVLIFMRTKFGAKALTKKLKDDGHKAIEIHSDLSFGQRRDAMAGFKSNKYRILVGTDVAARGIDVSGIEIVVNY